MAGCHINGVDRMPYTHPIDPTTVITRGAHQCARSGCQSVRPDLVTPWYGRHVAKTKKVTITLPVELLESMKSHTDNVSGYLTELAERAERRRLLREELDSYQRESGTFTDEEMAQARALLRGSEGAEHAT